MCGRYALGLRASFVRQQLQREHMRVDEAPDDGDVRETYNFAPGYYGLVYRADASDTDAPNGTDGTEAGHSQGEGEKQTAKASSQKSSNQGAMTSVYKLQAMKWGLVPFWTKRNPDYGSVMKTINARDDSLLEDRGMWTTMKKRKRCIVVAQGFYEWLKKNGGRDKIPHYVKRADGQLMCFAGMWDMVRYEGSDEKHYTYTIITTNSNEQLRFLHDRMPVILENGSEELRTWLDPSRSEWTKELQSLLKPYAGQLDVYPVSKEVGKVGNDSPNFIVPVASTENKNNIANFFQNAKKEPPATASPPSRTEASNMSKQPDDRQTIDTARTEDNAPVPTEPGTPSEPRGIKRSQSEDEASPAVKAVKVKTEAPSQTTSTIKIPSKTSGSPQQAPGTTNRKTRSATSNGTSDRASPRKTANTTTNTPKITQFFGK